jgi:sphinganine-1-phosphate aldolase
VAAARARGPIDVPRDLLGALTPEAVTPELIASLAEGLGLAVGGPPGPMAAVNTLLNAAPPRLREALLTGFLSLLQRP